MLRFLSTAVAALLAFFSMLVQAAEYGSTQSVSDFCLAARSGPEKGRIGVEFERKVRNVFGGEQSKAEGLLYSFQRACRADLIDLSPSAKYLELLDLLRLAREDYETNGEISTLVLKKLEGVGVSLQEVRSGRGKAAWQLVIDAKAKADMRIRPASAVASNGYLFIEAFRQLEERPEFDGERKVFLDAIEKSAREILKYPDENGDGRIGWGRLWFKGSDGLLLHTSVPAQNMYFGGYTYFPRADASGRSMCEESVPLKEEAFDHAHNVLFLLETFLVTRDADLAKGIIATVGKSFDDTYSEGGPDVELGRAGWYYWKQIGKQRKTGLDECEDGREIKNTNLRMGLALLAFSQIVKRNQDLLRNDPTLSFESSKYLDRAKQVIATNNREIFANNNFGYQGIHSRRIEINQQPGSARTVYDRTQVFADLNAPLLRDLKSVIAAGNETSNRSAPDAVTICSGGSAAPKIDRGVAGSCWNHLAFEAEDYFRMARFSGLWSQDRDSVMREYLDAIARNLAAAKIIHDGRQSDYAHYYPGTEETSVSNDAVNATYYGFFCLARNIGRKPAASGLPAPHRRLFDVAAGLCSAVPPESRETGVTWRRGYKFYELYLGGDRFDIPADDWLLLNKR